MRGRPILPVSKEERGRGRGADYVAYVQAADGVSRGQRNRILSPKLGREVVLLSIGEKDVYLILERSGTVTDIREQFPLYPIDETIAIAKQLGVRPCALNLRGKPMTTDFLVTCREGQTEQEIAISYKPLTELADPRVLELAEIERCFHHRRGAAWGFVTDQDLPRTTVDNLDLLADFYSLKDLAPLTTQEVDDIAAALLPRIQSHRIPLNMAALEVDELLGYDPGTTLGVTWHLMASRRIPVNLEKALKPDEPLPQ